MDLKILHLSSVRARVRADFRLTPDVKVYLKKRAAKIENIKKVDFLSRWVHFLLLFLKKEVAVVYKNSLN